MEKDSKKAMGFDPTAIYFVLDLKYKVDIRQCVSYIQTLPAIGSDNVVNQQAGDTLLTKILHVDKWLILSNLDLLTDYIFA
jgi:hypothetical protein